MYADMEEANRIYKKLEAGLSKEIMFLLDNYISIRIEKHNNECYKSRHNIDY